MNASGRPRVVLVVGRPASGKSTAARRIADRFSLPLLAKDELKELLFDTVGTGDRQFSRSLGRAAFALLAYTIERLLQTGRPFVVDAAYDARFENSRFQAWQEAYGFDAIQVHCRASDDELLRRFAARAASGDRHAGHVDAENLEEFRRSLRIGREEVLRLRGLVLDLDSTRAGATEELLDRLGALGIDDVGRPAG